MEVRPILGMPMDARCNLFSLGRGDVPDGDREAAACGEPPLTEIVTSVLKKI